jgi:hypothetical protein
VRTKKKNPTEVGFVNAPDHVRLGVSLGAQVNTG